MPPWLVSLNGFIPPVKPILDLVLTHLSSHLDIPTIYQYVRSNLNVAVPSLHAGVPLLTLLMLYHRMGKLKLLMISYVLEVWFSVVYLDEHYVFDVIIGAVYAGGAFLLIKNKKLIFTRIIPVSKRSYFSALVLRDSQLVYKGYWQNNHSRFHF